MNSNIQIINKELELFNNNNNNLISINIIENKILYMILHLDYNTYPICIITDFDKYCYAETSLEKIIDLSIFNINMIINSKKINDIFNILNKYIIINNNNNDNDIKLINNDPFNIYNNLYENTKYIINYDKLLNIKLKEPSYKYNYSHNKIPKDLLLSSMQIKKLIINEIKKINRNNNYDHYIIPEDDNIFSLIVRLKFNKNSNLYNIFKKINDKYNYDYMEFKLILDSTTYPYMPPKLEYIKPRINFMLFMSISNLEILKYNNWNPLISLEYLIINLANEIDKLSPDYILLDLNTHSNLEYEIMKLASIIKEDFNNIIKIDININTLSQNNTNNYWKDGTGYGHSNTNMWNINNYIKDQELLNNNITNILYNINLMINNDNINIILDSFLIKFIITQLKELNILELEKNKNLYIEIFNILNNMIDKNINQELINDISNGINYIYNEIELLLNTSTDIYNNDLLLQIHSKSKWYIINNNINNNNNNIIDNINVEINEKYVSIMKKLQFNTYELPDYHRFIKHKDEKLDKKALMRILSEISSFKSSLPLNYESTIWVRIPKDKFNIFSFIISGPKDTPYENGLFEFHAHFNNDYPNTQPNVLLHTTGNNTFRFNPNLYDSGKVCLSLLGTWSGSESEKWNSKTSTFLQVMVSIQSLIFIEQPYFNEPGLEKFINTTKGNNESNIYNLKIQPKTIELAMIDMINNPPIGFEEVVKEHFKLKKDEIINKTLIWSNNNDKINNIRNKLINLLNKY
jgi:ubiquitin-protein ligase